MIFDHFPFDIHDCHFKVQSLEHSDASITFEYETNTTGILWKTQTILEHAVSFTVLADPERSTKFKDLNGITEQYSSIGVTITMSRKYLPFLIDYFLPAGLFVLVSWVQLKCSLRTSGNSSHSKKWFLPQPRWVFSYLQRLFLGEWLFS